MHFYGGQSSSSSVYSYSERLSLSHRHWVMSFFYVSVISVKTHSNSLFFWCFFLTLYLLIAPVVWATWPIDPARYFHRNRTEKKKLSLFFVCVTNEGTTISFPYETSDVVFWGLWCQSNRIVTELRESSRWQWKFEINKWAEFIYFFFSPRLVVGRFFNFPCWLTISRVHHRLQCFCWQVVI